LRRTVDIIAASVMLLLAAPLMAAVAFLIRLRMGRPIMFRQERAGWGGAAFNLYKFRTMSLATEHPTGDESQRLTPLGGVLRRFSLDELPQLWNVVRGDMSLVGPRPLPTTYLPRYSVQQLKRHLVRPGITGWAQVNGRNRTSWDHRLSLDVWYVENRSVALDISILFRTVTAVLLAKDTSPEDSVTMEEFRGSTK
jgi:sugar transferase EpsL